MNANQQLEGREQILATLAGFEGAKSTKEIARQLGIGVRDVIHFRHVAGVRPLFLGIDGQRYYAPADVAKIRAAFEASDLKAELLDQSPASLAMEERELDWQERLGTLTAEQQDAVLGPPIATIEIDAQQ